MTLLMTLLIGIVAGLRAMTAPAAVAWGAWLGWIACRRPGPRSWARAGRSLIFSVLALGELVTDQLPSTPSRKVPLQFGAPHRQRRLLRRGPRHARRAA